MTHAAPPPGSLDDMVVAMVRAYCANPNERAPPGGSPAWNRAAELVQAWLAYERDVSLRVYEVKAKAEREHAIEEAAQCCRIVAEKPCSGSVFDALMLCHDAILALKVIP